MGPQGVCVPASWAFSGMVPFLVCRGAMLFQSKDQCFPGGSAGKESTCNAGNTGDVGSIPGSGRSPGEEMATHSSILAWKIPWTEEHGGLQPERSHKSPARLSN